MSTILIVDDTNTDRQLAAKVVSSMGNVPAFAQDGAEALSMAKDLSPDLILLDIVMPNQDGFATCRKLKKDPSTKDIPVIMISTKDGDSDKLWAQRQGAHSFVAKPYTSSTLQSAIQSALG